MFSEVQYVKGKTLGVSKELIYELFNAKNIRRLPFGEKKMDIFPKPYVLFENPDKNKTFCQSAKNVGFTSNATLYSLNKVFNVVI